MTLPSGNNGKRKLSEEMLQAYLEGRLSPAEQREVELWLADEGMESDALEGLLSLPPDEIKQSVTRLNYNLKKATKKKRQRRRPLNTDQFTWIAIVIVLFLIIIAFILIRKSI